VISKEEEEMMTMMMRRELVIEVIGIKDTQYHR